MKREKLWLEVDTQPSERAAHWENFMKMHMNGIFGIEKTIPYHNQNMMVTKEKGKKRDITEVIEETKTVVTKKARVTDEEAERDEMDDM